MKELDAAARQKTLVESPKVAYWRPFIPACART